MTELVQNYCGLYLGKGCQPLESRATDILHRDTIEGPSEIEVVGINSYHLGGRQPISHERNEMLGGVRCRHGRCGDVGAPNSRFSPSSP